MTSNDHFETIEADKVPLDPSGNCLVDIYVHLPTSERFIRYIPAGDPLDPTRLAALQEHSDPKLYVEKNSNNEIKEPKEEISMNALPEDFKIEVVGTEVQKELTQVFKSFMDPVAPPSTILAKIEEHADKIVDAIAPETKDLKGYLMRNVKYIRLMNDTSAITALAILIALASGYDSKKSYRDLCYACLIMDAALSEFDDQIIRQYYIDRTQLDPQVWDKIKKHPVVSHQLASEKMKSMSDVSLQLVLNHHELFNGKGYPRGVRYESLFPMVKVLSFAVDVFETIKKSELSGTFLQFTEAIQQFKEDKTEAHMRRHSKKLVDTVIDFLAQNPEVVAAANEGS